MTSTHRGSRNGISRWRKPFGPKMALSLKYVGNHGIWEQISNTGLNAYCGSPSGYGHCCQYDSVFEARRTNCRCVAVHVLQRIAQVTHGSTIPEHHRDFVRLQLELNGHDGVVPAAILVIPIPAQLHLGLTHSISCLTLDRESSRSTSIPTPVSPARRIRSMLSKTCTATPITTFATT